MSDSVMTDAERGKKFCDVPGYGDCWVQFKTSGYPRKLRREWDAANADGVWAIVTRYTLDGSLLDLAASQVKLPASYESVGNVEDAVVAWVLRAFIAFWLTELLQPRPN